MTDPTVFIVDDDAAIRDALGLLVSLKGLRTSLFASAEDFLGVYDQRWRGCLLTDLKMAGMSGLDLQKALNDRSIDLPVVMLTAHGDVTTARAALKGGAVDFLEKPIDDEILLDVLRNAIRIDAQRHEVHTLQQTTDELLGRLTARERDVLDLLTAGATYRDIGATLGISPRTVEVYRSRMLEKLRCNTVAELVGLAAAAQAAKARI
jgi:two-component system, LuxR family, response regulator FixJ